MHSMGWGGHGGIYKGVWFQGTVQQWRDGGRELMRTKYTSWGHGQTLQQGASVCEACVPRELLLTLVQPTRYVAPGGMAQGVCSPRRLNNPLLDVHAVSLLNILTHCPSGGSFCFCIHVKNILILIMFLLPYLFI